MRKLVWLDPEDAADFPVDEWECQECKAPIGVLLDEDYYGEYPARLAWRPVSTDGVRRFCEDCTPLAELPDDPP